MREELESKESKPTACAARHSAFEDEAEQAQVGLGVDIVEIERMERILERSPSFARKVFSEAERAYCDSKPRPASHYATRFAAKEAVLKALGTGFSQGRIKPRDIEVGRKPQGRPYVILSGRAREAAEEHQIVDMPISLSYTHTEAVACAMAITASSVRIKEERVDPMEELTKRFKEARDILNELDMQDTSNRTTALQIEELVSTDEAALQKDKQDVPGSKEADGGSWPDGTEGQ